MLIAIVGIPGCGKSTIAKLLARELSARCFLEPEEAAWPETVTHRDQFGYFTCIHAFRSLRLPGLMRAHGVSSAGGIAIIDSYYDKLCAHWLGRADTEWLLKPEDPYFPNFQQTAWLDYRYLPDADVIVIFQVEKADWEKMVLGRGRKLDKDSNLLQMFAMQPYFAEAARRYEIDRKGSTRLVEFTNSFGQPEAAVASLRSTLAKAGVV